MWSRIRWRVVRDLRHETLLGCCCCCCCRGFYPTSRCEFVCQAKSGCSALAPVPVSVPVYLSCGNTHIHARTHIVGRFWAVLAGDAQSCPQLRSLPRPSKRATSKTTWQFSHKPRHISCKYSIVSHWTSHRCGRLRDAAGAFS